MLRIQVAIQWNSRLLVNGSSILLVVAKTGENPTYPYHAPNYTKLEVLVFSKYTSHSKNLKLKYITHKLLDTRIVVVSSHLVEVVAVLKVEWLISGVQGALYQRNNM